MRAPFAKSSWEPILFWSLLALHCVPLLAFRWFPTVDGPSLLYNARILKDLLAGDPFTAQFFRIDHFPEPYWLGHALLAALFTVVPAWCAEKCVALLCVVGLAVAFRTLIRTLRPDSGIMSLVILPFLYSFVFRLGFFNFCLSLVLLLITLQQWALVLKAQTAGRKARSWYLRMWLLLTLLYFAHPSTYLIGIALLVAWTIWHASHLHSGPMVERVRTAWPMLQGLALAAAPTLVLTGFYVMRHTDAALQAKHLPLPDLLRWILDGAAWVTLIHDPEVWCTRPVMLVLITWSIIRIIRSKWATEDRALNGFWPWATLAALLAFLILPDQMATGSILSQRLLLIAMLLLAIWLSAGALPRIARNIGIVVIVLAQLPHLWMHYRYTQDLDRDAEELLSVLPQVKDGSVLLPLNYSDNWLHGNLSAYIGASRNATVLDNFLACAAHSPTQWRVDRLPYDAIGDFQRSNRPCVRIDAYRDAVKIPVDLVLLWHWNASMTDSCTTDAMRQLNAGFTLVASSPSGNARLYSAR